jgi:hypothetical protein
LMSEIASSSSSVRTFIAIMWLPRNYFQIPEPAGAYWERRPGFGIS